jgi:hypothetical protein
MEEVLKYIGLYIATPVAAVFSLYEFYFKKVLGSQIDERMQKNINEHSLSLGNEFSRKMADYNKYVDKKHSVYSSLAEKIILAQSLLHDRLEENGYPNSQDSLANVPDELIRKYIEENKFKLYSNAIEEWAESLNKDDAEYKAKKLKKFITAEKITKLLVFGKLTPELWQYYHLNKLYLSHELSVKIYKAIEEIFSFKEIKSIWGDKQKTNRGLDNAWMENTLKNIDKEVDEIISLMRKELSS